LRITSIIIYLFFIALSILFFIASFWIPNPEILQNRFGPRLFPQIILVAIVILIAFLLYQEIGKPKNEKIPIYKTGENKNRFLKTIFISFLFALLFSWIGGIPAIFIFVLGFIWIWKVRHPIILIFMPFLVSLFIYLVFHIMLSVRFPKGFIGIFF